MTEEKMSKKEEKELLKKAKFENLLSPIKLGEVEMKNRIAVAPMNETMSGHNGEANRADAWPISRPGPRAVSVWSAPGPSWAPASLLSSSGAVIFIISTTVICRGSAY